MRQEIEQEEHDQRKEIKGRIEQRKQIAKMLVDADGEEKAVSAKNASPKKGQVVEEAPAKKGREKLDFLLK